MGQRRKLRTLLCILKDGMNLMKASLSLNRTAASIQIAVLRATSAAAITNAANPSDDCLVALLHHGRSSRLTARACVASLMDRLHATGNSTVALKSLITIHNIISRSSFILRDQLSFFPSSGGRNFLNLSSFRDDSDAESWEMSSWVRWYAEFLEQILITSRVLGYFLISSPSGSKEAKTQKVSALLNPVLIREIEALTSVIEQIRNHPQSIHLQKNNLVYEMVRLVCEEYGAARSELLLRLVELRDRTDGLGHSELTQSIGLLEKLEDCKEKLLLLFGNRKNNDGLWELVANMRMELSAAKEKKEGWKLVLVKDTNSSELTQSGGGFLGPGKVRRLASAGGLPGLDLVPLPISSVG